MTEKIITSVDQLKGREEQIRTADNQNVVNGSGQNGELTEDDFSDMMNLLQAQSEKVNDLNWVVLTGYTGFVIAKLKYAWEIYGKQKLPRKLKKKIYMTKKIRIKYLPQYYQL